MSDSARSSAVLLDTPPEETAPPPRPLSTLRSLLPHICRYRALIVGFLVSLGLSSATFLTLPVAVRHVIDHGFGGTDPAAIDPWFIGLLVIALILAVTVAARFFFVSLLGERVAADLRKRVYQHLMRLDIAFYERTRSGELISRLSADVELLRSLVGSYASAAIRNVVHGVGAMIMLAVTNLYLAGLVLLGLPFLVLPILFFSRRLKKVSRVSQDRTADATARAGETLNAMHTVQSYAREEHESERYSRSISQAYNAARHRIGMQACLTGSMIAVIFGAITGVLWLGAKDVIAGNLSSGELGQFVLYAFIMASSAAALSEVWSEVKRAAGGMLRIRELMTERPAITVANAPHVLSDPIRGDIRFEDVVFYYPSRPDVPALADFNLHIREGERIALVGPSGAGKSTVLQLLMRFYDVSAGRVRVDGVDVRDLDPTQLRGQIALVPQDPVIFGADAAENIRYGRIDADKDEIIAAAGNAEAHEFIMKLPEAYDTYLGERGVRLSGGQQQRLAIARAVLKNAPILLLDEATSALDAQSERAIQQAMERLMQDRTTLVIAHRLATVQNADRIIVLDGGRIVAQGTHTQLIAEDSLYAELARLQFVA